MREVLEQKREKEIFLCWREGKPSFVLCEQLSFGSFSWVLQQGFTRRNKPECKKSMARMGIGTNGDKY